MYVVRYAIRHDGAMFHKINGIDQSWFVASGLDVLLALGGFVSLLLFLLFKCARMLCCGSKTPPADKKKRQ